MALTAEPVEHDTADTDGRVEGGKARRDRCGRLRLSRHIEHQQHWKAKARGKIGSSTGTTRRARDAIE